jgi:hypothetical protein
MGAAPGSPALHCLRAACWPFRPQGIEESNVFRRSRLYNIAVDVELRKWYYGLQKVFLAYADRSVRLGLPCARLLPCLVLWWTGPCAGPWALGTLLRCVLFWRRWLCCPCTDQDPDGG